MRRTKKAIAKQLTAAVVISAMLGFGAVATSTYADTQIEDEETIEIDVNRTYLSGTTGWKQESGRWCYYKDGVKQTGALYLEDGEYLLDSNGYMVTGWYRESSDAPYFYYDPLKGGAKAYGLTTINGVTYYFYGYMRTDFAVVEDGVFYYFGADGALESQKSGISDGWLSVGGDWYYVENGKLYGGLKTIGSATYYFESGKMVTNEIRMVLDESGEIKWYAFGANGCRAIGWWADSDGAWYYVTESGTITTGWQVINGNWYYFESSGEMVTGWKVIGGNWYYFSSSGAMVTGWQVVGNAWYYFQSGGQMVTGWQVIGENWYYFSSSGAMVTGWQVVGSDWYYFQSGGQMVTGWQMINGTYYYFDSNGVWSR